MSRPAKSSKELTASEREFRALMAGAGCEDFAECAELLGLPERTVYGYAIEDRKPPGPVKRLLRLCAKDEKIKAALKRMT